MIYDVGQLPLQELLLPLTKAGEGLARLDECIANSPIREGYIDRQNFSDAISSLWIDGELVHMEDLVLHDAHMDIRAPTHELTQAHRVLRTRRRILGNAPTWALSNLGITQLRGRSEDMVAPETKSLVWANEVYQEPEPDEDGIGDALEAELSELDALIARSTATLDDITSGRAAPKMVERDPLIHDPDWDEDERLAEWRKVVGDSEGLPAVLRAAVLIDAWSKLEVLQRSPWLGRLLAVSLMRSHGPAFAHLPAVNVGLRAIRRERRYSRSRKERLVAILDAFGEAATIGINEHNRLLLAKGRMDRRLSGRRSNSRLPDLVNLVLSRPMVSAAMIVKELGTTPQGAIGLAKELELREMTGRGRFRAWGVL